MMSVYDKAYVITDLMLTGKALPSEILEISVSIYLNNKAHIAIDFTLKESTLSGKAFQKEKAELAFIW